MTIALHHPASAPTLAIAAPATEARALQASIHAHRIRRAEDMVSWLGRSALVAADFAYPSVDGLYRGRVLLDAAADRVTIDLLDGEGLIVHSIHAIRPAAAIDFVWNGLGDFGLAEGRLRIRVVARAGTRAVATITNVWTPITAIESPANARAARAVTPNGHIAPEAVIALR